MNREEFLAQLSPQVKLVRTEYDLTQEQMAHSLGISKKTLVQIEKGRSSLGWTEAVALTTLFGESTVLQNAFGGELRDLVMALAFDHGEPLPYPRTMGGKVWWTVVEEERGWRIQQNVISRHYRLLDNEDRCRVSSFDLKVVQDCWRAWK